MSDEEFLANLQNIDNEKLIQSLQSCGHDGYYNDLYYPIIEEIKRRLSFFRSAGPERKKGKWVFKTVFPNDTSEFPMGYLVCSECGSKHSNDTPCNFCDNCGADMRDE